MAGGIYIHIPFCLRKCYYCDFYSKPIDDSALRKDYARALTCEISFYGAKLGKDFEVDSVFFGGGTPSLMEPELIKMILDSVRADFTLAEDAEITMECNPATLNAEKLTGYRKAGVNRLSIGAQSFDDEILTNLGRLHRSSDVEETVTLARKAGFDNINIDLMFAVPGQTVSIWEDTLKKAIGLNPEHISFYSLEIAEGTPFDTMLREGTIKETAVETDREMYRIAAEEFARAGYNHYEISNAAKAGREAKHNLKYWQFDDYLGIGASAHSFIGGVRFANVADVEDYIRVMMRQDMGSVQTLGKSTVAAADSIDWFHINSTKDSMAEYTFTALRTKGGVNLNEFESKMKVYFWDVYSEERSEFEEFVRGGYAVSDSTHIALTYKGIDISNKIMALFV